MRQLIESILVIENLPTLETVSLSQVTIHTAQIEVSVDTISDGRLLLNFCPYQALKVTTNDCFIPPETWKIDRQKVMEVVNSRWCSSLDKNLKLIDHDATFMDQARHFLLAIDDGFLEIVSHGFTLSEISR